MTKPTKYLPPSEWRLDNLPSFMWLGLTDDGEHPKLFWSRPGDLQPLEAETILRLINQLPALEKELRAARTIPPEWARPALGYDAALSAELQAYIEGRGPEPIIRGDNNPLPTSATLPRKASRKGIRPGTMVKVLFWLGFAAILLGFVDIPFITAAGAGENSRAVFSAVVYLLVIGLPLTLAGVGVFGKGDSEGHEGEGWGD